MNFDKWSMALVISTLLVSICGYAISWMGIAYFRQSEANPALSITPLDEVVRLVLILGLDSTFFVNLNDLRIRRTLLGAVLAFFLADAVWDIVNLATGETIYLMAFSAMFTAAIVTALIAISQSNYFPRLDSNKKREACPVDWTEPRVGVARFVRRSRNSQLLP